MKHLSQPVQEQGGPSEPRHKLRRILSGDLDNIVLMALRKEPGRRYMSVEQLAEDIRRHLNGLPVSASRASWGYRARKFALRHKVGMAATTVVLIVVLAGIAATVWQARIAAANARRAEQRFNDVRKLANSLIFEVNDSIVKVPGTTPARKIILERALEYLNSLSKEAGDEPDLLRELATAYERIGALQGDPLDPNLGDVKGAAVNLKKALEMRESLARLNPAKTTDQVELAIADLDYSDFQGGVVGDIVSAFDYCKRALIILDRERSRAPDNIRIIAQSTRAYTSLGLLQIGNGATGSVGTVKDGVAATQQALLLDQHGIQLDPTNRDLLTQEVPINILLGDGMLKLGDRRQALAHYYRGLDISNSLHFKRDDIVVVANTVVLTGKIADVLLAEGKIGEAINWFTKTQQGAARLLASDPTNEIATQLFITGSGQLGHALVEGGRTREGLTHLQAAFAKAQAWPEQTPLIRIFQGLLYAWFGETSERSGKLLEAVAYYRKGQDILDAVVKAGVNDLRTQVYYCSTTDRLAAGLLKIQKTEDARREYEKSRTLLESLYQTNLDNMEVMYALAETYTGEGNVSEQLAKHGRGERDKTSNWRATSNWYQKSLEIWGRVANPTRFSTSTMEVTLPAEVSRRLAEAQAQQAAVDRQSSSAPTT